MTDCRLYLISPPAIDLEIFPALLEAALVSGNVGSFQLRLKETGDEKIIAAANILKPLCHRYECAFILNDRPDLAKEMQADGVHLGQDDLEIWPIAETRQMLGEEAVIGVSCHASPHLAMEAGEQGADYVAFGAFYPTISKPMEKLLQYGTPEPGILTWWSTYTVLPCVAIGGITPANATPLVQAGADFLAVITAVWDHPKGAGVAVKELNQAINVVMPAQAGVRL